MPAGTNSDVLETFHRMAVLARISLKESRIKKTRFAGKLDSEIRDIYLPYAERFLRILDDFNVDGVLTFNLDQILLAILQSLTATS